MDPQAVQHLHPYLHQILHLFLVFYVFFVVIWTIPVLQMARKAGLHFSIALLTLIGPLGLLIAFYILAFSRWKTPQA